VDRRLCANLVTTPHSHAAMRYAAHPLQPSAPHISAQHISI
jgi:hypothetical protein